MTGWQTLFYKEVLRFWKVSFQTIAQVFCTAQTEFRTAVHTGGHTFSGTVQVVGGFHHASDRNLCECASGEEGCNCNEGFFHFKILQGFNKGLRIWNPGPTSN